MRAPKLQKNNLLHCKKLAYKLQKSLPKIERSKPLNCKSARVYGLVTVWKIDDRKRKKQKGKIKSEKL